MQSYNEFKFIWNIIFESYFEKKIMQACNQKSFLFSIQTYFSPFGNIKKEYNDQSNTG